ncbi:MAG TPA: pentapeptide repeat-containing protein [Thermoanaerobaculia bacterium]|jgi:uncharacterized protein YjbI with pentapeptide repeats|nr:pentapeptide repeat-containing protein [Thermoanaerobaculia bacterium]
MKPGCSLRLVDNAVLAAALLLALSAGLRAQTTCAGAGPEAPIRLRQKGVEACVRGGIWIENAIVQGRDVVALARSPGLPVRIRTSVIERGLNFGAPPTVRVGALADPLHRHLRDLRIFTNDKSLVSVIRRAIQMRAVRIEPGLDYNEREYSWAALIANGVLFAEDIDLGGSSIEGSASFNRAAFLGRADFEGVRFAHGAIFDTTHFASDALFGGTQFQGAARFNAAYFGGEARFRGARFDRQPVFDRSTWCEEANFSEASFGAEARFTAAALKAGADFQDVELTRGADFSFARAGGPLSFRRLNGAGTLTFVGARLERLKIGSPDHRTRVDAELDFTCAQMASAILQAVRFNAPISFARAHIGLPRADRGSQLVGYLVDRGLCPLPSESTPSMTCTPLAGPRGPSVGKAAKEMPPELVLDRVDFSDKADWEGATIRAQVSFHDVSFDAGGNLKGVHFESPQDGAPFLAISEVDFAGVDVDWNSIPSDPALFTTSTPERPAVAPSALFRVLEDRYSERKRLDDVLAARRARWWATVAEARVCLADGLTTAGKRAPCRMDHPLWAATVYPLWGIVSGFSTLWTRLVAVTALVDLLFAIFYAYSRRLLKRRISAGEDPTGMRLRPLELPAAFASADHVEGTWVLTRSFRDALALSTAVLLRFGRTDVIVRGALGKLELRHVVTFEWLLGIPLLVDLVHTLTETQPFLQRLLTGAIG